MGRLLRCRIWVMASEEKRGPGRPPVANESRKAQVIIRVTSDEKLRWERAAEAAGMSMSEWARSVLGDAAERR